MARYIQVWYRCDIEGCEVMAECMVELVLNESARLEELPRGWSHKVSHITEIGQDICDLRHCYCPKHQTVSTSKCNHRQVLEYKTPEPAYTIICCPDVHTSGWQCIKSQGHEPPHHYGYREDGKPLVAPEEQI